MRKIIVKVSEVVLVVLASGFCAGCLSNSPAPRYYTLNMAPSGNGEIAGYNLEFEQLEAGESLSRQKILIKKNEIEAEYYARDQWLSPLSELVSEKLSVEFGGKDKAGKTLRVSGKIISFEQIDLPEDGAEGHIKLSLSFCKSGVNAYDEPLLIKQYEVFEKAKGRSASEVVIALSRGVEKIAGKIKRDIAKL